jgi:hypothetical protein
MKNKAWLFVVLFGILLFGCDSAPSGAGSAVSLCASPYIELNGRCCLDGNGDGVCDYAGVETDFSIDALAPVIVRINWQSNGSRNAAAGFFISDDKIITSWSLIKDYDSNNCFARKSGDGGAVVRLCSPYFRVMDFKGRVFDNHTLVSYSEQYDLAVIQLDSADLALARKGEVFSPVSFGGGLSVGRKVYLPIFSPALALKQNISGVGAVINSDAVIYRLDDSFSSDYFGLPVVDERLSVVGMLTEKLNINPEEKSFMIGSGELRRFSEYALMISCSPNCSLAYERMSEAVKIYKPKYVDAGRYHKSNSASDNKVYFKSFTISVNNDDSFGHSVCFNLRVIKNGMLLHSSVLYPELDIKSRMETTQEIKANWQDDSSGSELPQDYYFEVSGYDCASKVEYNKFYFREKY